MQPLTHITEKTNAAHVVKWARDISAGDVREFRFSAAVRRVVRKKKAVRPSVWAEKNRVLTTSVINGPWRNSVTPYLAGIMDAMAHPAVSTGIICKAPQVGGTEAAHNFVGYALDHAPGPVMYVFPDKDLASENSRDRIVPMLEASPALRGYFTGTDDDKARFRIKLRHAIIHMAWSHSTSSLSNKPVRYLILDEVDKYPPTTGKREASPVKLARKRQNTYRAYGRSKEVMLSSPSIETGNIWVALTTEAQIIFDYHVRCPHCGRLQHMKFDNIKWPDDVRDPEMMESSKLARYHCPHCEAQWTDHDRDRAVQSGQWMSRPKEDGDPAIGLDAYLGAYRPAKVGFHIPAWISPFVSMSECAAAFLKGLKDKEALKDFNNGYAAKPWVVYEQQRDEDQLVVLMDDRPAGLVPGNERVAGLTAGVDTQKHGFWYEIRAWGFGLDRDSWQIKAGYVTSFDALAQVLWEDTYTDADGNQYIVHMVLQDAMGDKTADVYDFCRAHRGRILPTQGVQQLTQPFTFSKVDTYPGTNRIIPGGLFLCRVNTTFYKNDLSNRLDVAPGDPGAWYFHNDTTREWLRHMTAEYVDEKGVWQCPSGKANHGWDCSVLNRVAADILNIAHWQDARGKNIQIPDPAKKPPDGHESMNRASPSPIHDQQHNPAASASNRQRPSWFNKRR